MLSLLLDIIVSYIFNYLIYKQLASTVACVTRTCCLPGRRSMQNYPSRRGCGLNLPHLTPDSVSRGEKFLSQCKPKTYSCLTVFSRRPSLFNKPAEWFGFAAGCFLQDAFCWGCRAVRTPGGVSRPPQQLRSLKAAAPTPRKPQSSGDLFPANSRE